MRGGEIHPALFEVRAGPQVGIHNRTSQTGSLAPRSWDKDAFDFLLTCKLSVTVMATLIRSLDPTALPSHLQRLSASLGDDLRTNFAAAFTTTVVQSYWARQEIGRHFELHTPYKTARLTREAAWLAEAYAEALIGCDPLDAGYKIGAAYTCALPPSFRSRLGVYYTPPALSKRLIHLITKQRLNWATARVVDGSCGGAAFLAPVALEMRKHLGGLHPHDALNSISRRLRGFEIDPFGAWLSQTLVEVALADLCIAAGERLPHLVTVQDSLAAPVAEQFDLVIGNPPFGRRSLTPEMRARYAESLYGHANTYGLFSHAALRWLAPNGFIAYVTPTSMLGGEYFKALRSLLAREAPPVSIDFVNQRAGVFENVLQETMLAVYRKGSAQDSVRVHFLDFQSDSSCRVFRGGRYEISTESDGPWLLPRSIQHRDLVHQFSEMPARLADYGYTVSTGPLVWNRHKKQFVDEHRNGAYPVIWAESITSSGEFIWRAAKVNHSSWFVPREKDQWVITRRPCVLVQRTTAKEQKRRLIAAELPTTFVSQYRGVIVENHLNMIRAVATKPRVSAATISALLNSEVLDSAFRCISGSVAVSASEIEALPLPSVAEAMALDTMIARGATKQEFEAELRRIYFQGEHVLTGIA